MLQKECFLLHRLGIEYINMESIEIYCCVAALLACYAGVWIAVK